MFKTQEKIGAPTGRASGAMARIDLPSQNQARRYYVMLSFALANRTRSFVVPSRSIAIGLYSQAPEPP